MTKESRYCTVSIIHDNKKNKYSLRKGLSLQALCVKNKTAIDYDCRDSDCGICILKVIEGSQNISKVQKKEDDFLKAMRADQNERLACQVRVFDNATLEVEY